MFICSPPNHCTCNRTSNKTAAVATPEACLSWKKRRELNNYVLPTPKQPNHQAATSVALAAATTLGVEACEGVAMASNVLTR